MTDADKEVYFWLNVMSAWNVWSVYTKVFLKLYLVYLKSDCFMYVKILWWHVLLEYKWLCVIYHRYELNYY